MFGYVREQWGRLVTLWRRYERHVGAGALIFGFIFDSLTLTRPDQLIDNAILLSYLVLIGGVIIFLSLRSAGPDSSAMLFLPLVLQFSFGNLTSGLLVLYARSGTLAGSLIFFCVLGGLLLSNEFLRNRYTQLRFNIVIYYLLVLLYLTLTVPILLRDVGAGTFLTGGVASLFLITGFLYLLFLLAPQQVVGRLRGIGISIATLFVVFNVLYFLNVIPPVPLALKEVGIYHSILPQSSGSYVGVYEKRRWYELFSATSKTYALTSDRTAFCFSSVFAPSGIETPIYHRWEFYDEARDRWETRSRISFTISGGRDEGYRGFTQKAYLEAGRWRCSIETEGGALIGRFAFRVVRGVEPALVQKSL